MVNYLTSCTEYQNRLKYLERNTSNNNIITTDLIERIDALEATQKNIINGKKSIEMKYKSVCTFDGTFIKAPEWICGGNVEGFELTAVGICDINETPDITPKKQREIAIKNARKEIGNQIEVKVTSFFKEHTQYTKGKSETDISLFTKSFSNVLVDNLIIIKKLHCEYNNYIYVLAGIKPKKIKEIIRITNDKYPTFSKRLLENELLDKLHQQAVMANISKIENKINNFDDFINYQAKKESKLVHEFEKIETSLRKISKDIET